VALARDCLGRPHDAQDGQFVGGNWPQFAGEQVRAAPRQDAERDACNRTLSTGEQSPSSRTQSPATTVAFRGPRQPQNDCLSLS